MSKYGRHKLIIYQGRKVKVPISSYSYTSLSNDETEIRLLEILPSRSSRDIVECRLRNFYLNHDIPNMPKYTALSYEWGNPSNYSDIYVDNVKFPITVNLRKALQQLRLTTRRYYWIDAICINQNDRTERGTQVAKMQQIYRKADHVAVWLGRKDDSSANVMHILKRIDQSHQPEQVRNGNLWVPGREYLRRYVTDLVTFFENPYFRRVWIIQEIALGIEVSVICGSREVSWSALDILVQCVRNKTWIHGHAIDHLNHLCQNRSRQLDGRPVSLLQALYGSRNAEASEPRDRLYGILSLAFDSDKYVPKPDYFCPEELVCMNTTRTVIWAKRTLDIILLSSWSKDSKLNLPTWCPNYLQWPEDAASNRITRYEAGLDTRVQEATGSAKWQASAGSPVTADLLRFQDKLLLTWGIRIGKITGLGCPPRRKCRPSHTRKSFHRCGRSDRELFFAVTRTLGLYGSSRANPYTNSEEEEMSMLFYYLYTFDKAEKAGKKNSRYFREEYQTIIKWREANKDFHIFGKSFRSRSADIKARWYTGALKDGIQAYAKYGDNATFSFNDYGGNGRRLPAKLDVALGGLKSLLKANVQLMTTSRDDIGWAHPGAHLYDEIWLLNGCSLPVILRPLLHHEEKHIFIGYAYVEGVMNGEEWTRHGREDLEQVILR